MSSQRSKESRIKRLRIAHAIIAKAEGRREGTGRKHGMGRIKMATVASTHINLGSIGSQSASFGIAKAIRHALDPNFAPKPVKSFATMTEEERAEMRRLYERKK